MPFLLHLLNTAFLKFSCDFYKTQYIYGKGTQGNNHNSNNAKEHCVKTHKYFDPVYIYIYIPIFLSVYDQYLYLFIQNKVNVMDETLLPARSIYQSLFVSYN